MKEFDGKKVQFREEFQEEGEKKKMTKNMSVQSLQEQGKLGELKSDLMDLVDMTVEQLEMQKEASEDPHKMEERIAFFEKSRKGLNNIFKVMSRILMN